MNRLLESGRLAFNWNAMPSCYHPQMKVREGNVFTPVCQSFCSHGVPSRGSIWGVHPGEFCLEVGCHPGACCPGWGGGQGAVKGVLRSGCHEVVPWRAGCHEGGVPWRGCCEGSAVNCAVNGVPWRGIRMLWRGIRMLWRGFSEGSAINGVLWRRVPWMGSVLWRAAVKGMPWKNPLWPTSKQYVPTGMLSC